MIFKHLLKDTAIYGGTDFLLRFISFFTFPLFALALTVEEFGVMALILTGTSLLNSVANLGLNNATQRFYWDKHTQDNERPSIVSTGLFIQIITTLIMIVVSIIILSFFKNYLLDKYSISWEITIFALFSIIPGNIINFTVDVLRLNFNSRQFLFFSIFRNLLSMGLTLGAVVWLKWKLEGYFISAFLASCLTVPTALWLIKHELTIKINWSTIHKLVKFGYPFIYVSLATWIFSSMDRWMLSELSSTTQTGYYAIAGKFANIPLLLSTAFGMAWSPIVFKLVSESATYREEIGKSLTVWSYLMFISCGVIILSARELLIYFTPVAYHQAALSIIFLTLGTLWQATPQITAFGISIEKQTHLFARITWFSAAMNLILNFILIPKLGSSGAALATMLSHLFVTSAYLFITQKLHPIILEKTKLFIIFSLICITTFIAIIIEYNFRAEIFSSQWWITFSIKFTWFIFLIIIGFLTKIIRKDFLHPFMGGNKWLKT